MLKHRARGFTLIELMVTLTIAAFLLLMAVPSFSSWMANAKVRSVAEEVQNGLRLAQTEAIRRNRQTVFALTSATPAQNATPARNGRNWYVQVLMLTGSAETNSDTDKGLFVQGSNYATSATVTVTGPALLCFGSLGSATMTSAATALASCSTTTPNAAAVTYTIASTTADRPMGIVVTPGGQVRMCDTLKTLSSSNPDGCPS